LENGAKTKKGKGCEVEGNLPSLPAKTERCEITFCSKNICAGLPPQVVSNGKKDDLVWNCPYIPGVKTRQSSKRVNHQNAWSAVAAAGS